MWNNWKDESIAELYRKTQRALRRGLENPIDKTERIHEVKEEALALINKTSINSTVIEKIWEKLGDDYFIRYSPDEIAWQTQNIARTSIDKLP